MDNIAIDIKELSKMYKLYDRNRDRLRDALKLTRKKCYREHYALKNVNVKIMKGETIGIIGTNGSGKSTLLKIITGVVTQTAGDIVVNGKIAALLELGAGFNPEYTGIENIYLQGTMMGYNKDEIADRVQSIIDFSGIENYVNQPVKTYSSGMFLRLAFAIAINVDPDILIVDEALAVGDLEFQLKCMEKFDEFREAGKTILYVSHDINSVKRYCSRCIWIQNGRLQSVGETDRITDKYLDYLKRNEAKEVTHEVSAHNIGVINEIVLTDEFSCPITEIEMGNCMKVDITYTLNQPIENLVIGCAIYNLSNQYICGLNTLLDDFKVSDRVGLHKTTLTYDAMNLIGGTYYLDVALFEKNAHVSLDYKAKVQEFTVISKYVGEGVCVLQHHWQEVKE